ncbi:putative endo-xylogalacturonan hydrolase A [Parachaetomium inaequale]|uniref:Endo-xylogalacturonan hydrolase A n=1 Tax=Parachaetomium inaequale TaxID=2588326 RepID=A0AAN6PQ71_9PEZI|nr:putative endo-xylogalacturonan hydrolase A [Parachaetomium inaequale]
MVPSFLSLLSLALALLPSEVVGVSGPSLTDHPTPSRIRERAATCTPTSAGRASVDDTPTIVSSFKQCGKGGVIVFPKGVTYMLRTQLSFSGCAGCEVRFDGRLKASDDLSYWNNTRYMVEVRGVKGAKIHSPLGTGELDGNGQAAWDRFGAHGDLRRPTLFTVEGSTDIHVSDLRLKNAQNVFVDIGSKSSQVSFSNMKLTALSKTQYRPRNTDGFDIGDSEHTTLSDIYIQNEDDCVAFKPGCNYVTVQNITCQGSHGLSVGSLGKKPGATDTVQNVYVKNAIMRNATKAAGIKTYPGGANHGTAVVRNVTWDGVQVDNCDAAFELDTCYNEDAEYCRQNPTSAAITDIYVKNFSGTTSKRYAPTTGSVFCAGQGDDCQLKFEKWTVKSAGGDGKLLCHNIAADVLGVDCVEADPFA